MSKETKSFEKGKTYKLKYKKTVPYKRWRGSLTISQWEVVEYSGEYEYIGSKGGKLHFYNNWAGVDILFTKKEALEALQNE